MSRRRLQPDVELRVQRPELVSDLLLGLARDLPAQPLPVRAEADRDRADVPVLVCREVDGILAMPAAPCRSVCHENQRKPLAPRLAPRRPHSETETPSDLVGATGFEPVTPRL